MLEYEGMDKFIQVVINIGFGENYGETEYNYNVRYRVLRVLQTVVDTSTLEKLTVRDICTFRYFFKSILIHIYVHINIIRVAVLVALEKTCNISENT